MFTIVAGANNEATIYLMGAIGEWEEVRAKDIITLLDKAKSDGAKKINLRVHSPGGSVLEAGAIYNAVKNLVNTGIEVYAYIDGIAASMASIIIAAATKVFASKLSRVMIHQSRISRASGTAADMRKYATQLETINEQFAEVYAEKTGKSKDWVKQNWLPSNEDVWFTATEAKAAGLVDDLVEPPKNIAPAKAEATIGEIIAHYDKFFENFIPIDGAANKTPPTKNPEKKMDNFQLPKKEVWAILELLGGAPSATIQGSLDNEATLAYLKEKAKSTQEKLAKLADLEATVRKVEEEKVMAAITARGGNKDMQDRYLDLLGKIGIEGTLDLLKDVPVIKDLTAVKSDDNKADALAGGAGGVRWQGVKKVSNPKGKTYKEMAIEDPHAIVAMTTQNPELLTWFAATEGARL